MCVCVCVCVCVWVCVYIYIYTYIHTGVPRVYSRIYGKVMAQIESKGWVTQRLFSVAYAATLRAMRAGVETDSVCVCVCTH